MEAVEEAENRGGVTAALGAALQSLADHLRDKALTSAPSCFTRGRSPSLKRQKPRLPVAA